MFYISDLMIIINEVYSHHTRLKLKAHYPYVALKITQESTKILDTHWTEPSHGIFLVGLSLTLSQWSSSGNPVAIQCAWDLDPSVHWNATGEMPVCFQWSTSGFPVVFQCVPIMQINTGLPLGHHWVQASVSVVPVTSQCTCGSSGLPVCSNYAN